MVIVAPNKGFKYLPDNKRAVSPEVGARCFGISLRRDQSKEDYFIFKILVLVLLTSGLLGCSGNPAADLPQPPAGYTWKQVPEIKGVFLIPAGWHYFQERQGNTFALFITKERIVDSGEFETGMSINAFLNTRSAPRHVKRMVESTAAKYGTKISVGVQQPLVRFTTFFDSPKPPTQKLIRIVTIGVVNADTATSYLVMFEAPVSAWREQWAVGEVLVNSLGFESEL